MRQLRSRILCVSLSTTICYNKSGYKHYIPIIFVSILNDVESLISYVNSALSYFGQIQLESLHFTILVKSILVPFVSDSYHPDSPLPIYESKDYS